VGKSHEDDTAAQGAVCNRRMTPGRRLDGLHHRATGYVRA